ncbi:tetratricopeptide repeat protein [Kordia sp.]|uniref:tetratricopeptide repeat protein n=1 Tax=Kordia sp. TaxID=1965332 RepID=UPI003B5B1291
MTKKKNGKGCLIVIGLIFILSIIGNLISKPQNEIYADASLKYRLSEYKEALELINEIIERDSTNTEYYELRGKILYELQDTLHSEEDFKRTLTFAKTDSVKNIRIKELINWDIQHDQKEKAKELLKEEVKLYKNDSIKHIEIMEYAAEKYLVIGDTLETIHLYRQLSNEYKKIGRFNNRIGILYSIMHKNKNALAEFKKAVKAEPNNDLFLYNLGISYLNLLNKRKAKLYFKKSMELGNEEACREYRELTAKTRYYQRTKCCDGTTSSASGRGACSHHSGVCGIVNIPYKVYTIECN